MAQAAEAIGIAKETLSVYLSSPNCLPEHKPRTDYDGNFRLTDAQVVDIHWKFLQYREKEQEEEQEQLVIFPIEKEA